MRKALLMSLLLFIWCSGIAQQPKDETSNAEKFSAKSGTLLQKEFIWAGEVKSIKIKVVKFTDMIVGNKQSALKFEYEAVGKYSSDTKVALLDIDEIDGLIKSISIMQEKVFPSTPKNYTEVSFKSRGGFEAGCFYDTKGQWSTYVRLDKYDSNSYVFLSKEDFKLMLQLIELAKITLNQI